jgi:uncharacterized cupredoxin-like copper-binding protein
MPRLILSLCLLLAAVACEASGEGGREIVFTQTDDGCTPDSVDVATGEKLKLTGNNESGQTYELEGTNGTEFEEILIPEGKTRSAGYTVPGEEGTYDIKCYQPGGASTIIALVATGDGSSDDGSGSAGEEDSGPITVGGNDNPVDETVDVALSSFKIEPATSSVGAGNVEFATVNTSTDEVHELAVLRAADDGTNEVVGEIEDIPAGDSAVIRLDLAAGEYELACLIVPGEAGSATDHYKEGMKTDFTVD